MKKVLTVGVFDYFHYGHLKLFERCLEYGDYLIVAIQDGDYILKYKPYSTILYSTSQRMEIVSSIKYVSKTIIYTDVDKLVEYLDFDVLVIGEDQNHTGFMKAEKWCKDNNKSIIHLPRTPGISSSDIKKSLVEKGNT